MLADGFPSQNGEDGGQRGQGVHSVYETKMIDRFATDLVTAIATKVAQLEPLPEVTSGAGAAIKATRPGTGHSQSKKQSQTKRFCIADIFRRAPNYPTQRIGF